MKTTMNMRSGVKIKSGRLSDSTQCYLLLGLPLIGFFVFTLYPILWAMRLSFFYHDGIPSNTVFVGIENFVNAFKDKVYWGTWLTTLQFAVMKLPIELPLALVLAVLLNKKIKGSGFFRTVYFMPTVISAALIALMFSNLFSVFGIVNMYLIKLGIIKDYLNWFETKSTAMWVLVISSIWNTFGTNILYFLGALQNVPEDCYEAAKIDGAGKLTTFFKITIPLIAPVAQTILLLSINGTLQTGEYVILLTNGAPGGETYTAGAYLIGKFAPGFAETTANIGYGCALSLVNTAITASVAAFYLKASKKMTNIY